MLGTLRATNRSYGLGTALNMQGFEKGKMIRQSDWTRRQTYPTNLALAIIASSTAEGARRALILQLITMTAPADSSFGQLCECEGTSAL
jgi:hypothetical protein